jgi:hypothetical protein
MPGISIQIDVDTYEVLGRLADALGTSVGEVVAIAVRRLRQQLIGRQLHSPLIQDELGWLAADLT